MLARAFTVKRFNRSRWYLSLALGAALAGCGGGSSGTSGTPPPPPPPAYSIGGTVSGLSTGASLVLLDNGGDALTVGANGPFTFKTNLAAGARYAVTIGTAPSGASCTVSNGSGSVGSASVTNVAVACSVTAPSQFTIGGSVSGLSTGGSLTLLDNGGDALTVNSIGPFTFPTALASGAAYAVTVGTQPSGESCTVSGGSGTVGSANVTTVAVSCTVAVASESLVYSFGPNGSTDGHGPNSLILGKDGKFYGTTSVGGTTGTGSVFSLTTAGVESIVYSFGTSTAVLGYAPQSLLQAADGNLYGVTNSGGAFGVGIAFKVTLGGTETDLHSFGNVDSAGHLDGLFPNSLIQATDGNLYGTTSIANANGGIAFQLTSSGTETVFYGFATVGADGRGPLAIIQGSDGNFYGTTNAGGANNTGAVFKITSAGAETLLYSFGPASGADAQTPAGGLVEGSDGNFYGMTLAGGTNGTGTVFRVTPSGSETVIYSFDAKVNNISPRPNGTLIQGSDGNLYGCTQHGGTLNIGTVFKLTTAGVHTIVHSFAAQGTDAAGPVILLQVQNGDIYGAAASGGANGTGAIFKITL